MDHARAHFLVIPSQTATNSKRPLGIQWKETTFDLVCPLTNITHCFHPHDHNQHLLPLSTLPSSETMTDLRQGTGLGRNHLCSLNPVCRSDGTCTDAKNSSDFDFWGERGTTDYDDLGRGEVEDQTRADTEGYYGAQSPRLWRGKNFGYEASPLLPYKHCHSYPSPKSRLQAIVDGRRELMEMVKDLPESSYELSLKDIVDEGHVLQGFQHEDDMSEGEKNRILETKVKSKQKTKKKKGIGRSQMLRSESMDSGVFLLKMFFPTSLAAKKKKPTVEHCPRGSPGASLEGSEKHGYKSWWKIRLLVTGGHEKSARNGRSSSSSSSSSRCVFGNFCLSLDVNREANKTGSVTNSNPNYLN